MDRSAFHGLISDVLWVLEGDLPLLRDDPSGHVRVIEEALTDISRRELGAPAVIRANEALRALVSELDATAAHLEEELATEDDAENREMAGRARRCVELIGQLVDPQVPPPAPPPAAAPVIPAPASVAAAVKPPPAAKPEFVRLPDPPGGFGDRPAEPGSHDDRLVFVAAGDWEGVYFDGRLICEDHRISGFDLARAMGMAPEHVDPPSEGFLYQKGALPARLEDLPATREQP